ncbi:hypothetical protein, partial [uncultured Alcanivorax sp.]|uniref:hypothetical protein n=1 Tax=uncultured Alcanivorax sp. TaxID=191215 RepID=UPI00260C1F06
VKVGSAVFGAEGEQLGNIHGCLLGLSGIEREPDAPFCYYVGSLKPASSEIRRMPKVTRPLEPFNNDRLQKPTGAS